MTTATDFWRSPRADVRAGHRGETASWKAPSGSDPGQGRAARGGRDADRLCSPQSTSAGLRETQDDGLAPGSREPRAAGGERHLAPRSGAAPDDRERAGHRSGEGGRQADALDAYNKARRHLVDELGDRARPRAAPPRAGGPRAGSRARRPGRPGHGSRGAAPRPAWLAWKAAHRWPFASPWRCSGPGGPRGPGLRVALRAGRLTGAVLAMSDARVPRELSHPAAHRVGRAGIPLPERRSPRSRGGFIPSGARGARTPDLLHAMQALSQLSYGPRSPVILTAATV
jgi:hypothetical protein